ncbi:MAG: TraI domain-containing protein [Zoogloea sp.]|nr:TraI domain-containing protein [Zoogloea sp.]
MTFRRDTRDSRPGEWPLRILSGIAVPPWQSHQRLSRTPPPTPVSPRCRSRICWPAKGLIARIKLCYGIDRQLERDVLMLVRRYAACVHLLPATADNYFSKPGGLLRPGLRPLFFQPARAPTHHIFRGRMSISGTLPTRAALAPSAQPSSPVCVANCTG